MKQPPRIYRPDPQPVQPFARWANVKFIEVTFKTAKNGQRRATYYEKRLNRWLPIPVDAAEYLIADGRATEV